MDVRNNTVRDSKQDSKQSREDTISSVLQLQEEFHSLSVRNNHLILENEQLDVLVSTLERQLGVQPQS